MIAIAVIRNAEIYSRSSPKILKLTRLSPHAVVLSLADVVMVLPNLSWMYIDYGNFAVTVVPRPQ